MHEDKRLPLAVLCAVAAVFATAAVPALAKGPHGSTTGNSLNAGTHLTICHATPPDTAANGYVRISPSVSGVYHGHLRQHAADIIPPFVYAGTTYSQNWDATGQAIWNNGCVTPSSSTSTSGSSTSGSSGTNGSSGSSGTSGSSSTSGSGTSPASSTSTHGVAGASKTIKHRARPAKPVTRGATFTG